MVQDDLTATARLAHLDLSESETKAALPAFEQMLGFFAAMRAADADVDALGVSVAAFSPSAAILSAGNRLRTDAVNGNNNNYNPPNSASDFNLADAILAASPEQEERFLVVPNVL